MLQTLYLGKIYGTKIYIHWSFWILAIVVFLSNVSKGFGPAVSALGFIFSVFACVFLHELGHALAARRFGRPTLDITLLPIGGIARIQGSKIDPWSDGWIAIAGPMVNFAIALVLTLGIFLGLFPAMDLSKISISDLSWAQQLLIANIAIGVFNLLPLFPLDGGRILRCLLCYFTSRESAIDVSARIGQWGSGLWIAFCLWNLDFIGMIFGVVLFGINTFERIKTKLIVVQQRGQSWPFPTDPNDPFGLDRPSRSDTIDAEDVRVVEGEIVQDTDPYGSDEFRQRNFPRP
ncbi:MAG: putative zinc metalloprotease Rip3 [Planctomycetota bacterium]|jgi:Zn-dependent protease